MSDAAYLSYSNRTVAEKTGGRHDLTERWIVPNIQAIGGGVSEPDDAWQHEALAADKLPELGDVKQDGGYVCVSRTPRSLEDQGFAYVDVRWQEDPLTLPTEVTYLSATKVRPAWKGIAISPPSDNPPAAGEDDFLGGFDIRNSAGDRNDPPVTFEIPLERIEVSFHCSLAWHDEQEWDSYLKHWNASDWTVTQTDPDNDDNSSSVTYSAGSVMFMDKRAVLVKEPFFHRFVTCVFLCDPDLWGTRVPDMGPRCKKHLAPDGAGGVTLMPWPGGGQALGPVTDTLSRPYSGIAELDGQGNQLLPNTDGTMPEATIYQWWPVDDDENLLSAEFDDLDLFTPEREAKL